MDSDCEATSSVEVGTVRAVTDDVEGSRHIQDLFAKEVHDQLASVWFQGLIASVGKRPQAPTNGMGGATLSVSLCVYS